MFLILPDFHYHLPFYIYAAINNEWISNLREKWQGKEVKTTILSDLFTIRHFILCCDIQSCRKISVGQMPGPDMSESQMNEELKMWKEVLVERVMSLTDGKAKNQFMTYGNFLKWLFICGVHACSSLILSTPTKAWFGEEILMKIATSFKNKDTEDYIYTWKQLSTRGHSKADTVPSGIIEADFFKTMKVVDFDIFESLGQQLFDSWCNEVHTREAGQFALARKLVENQIISSDEATELLRNNVSVAMQAAFSRLPESMQQLINRVFPIVSEEGHYDGLDITRKKDLHPETHEYEPQLGDSIRKSRGSD